MKARSIMEEDPRCPSWMVDVMSIEVCRLSLVITTEISISPTQQESTLVFCMLSFEVDVVPKKINIRDQYAPID